MKKILSVLLILTLILSLCACTKTPEQVIESAAKKCEKGEYDKAVVDLEKLLEAEPENIEALKMLVTTCEAAAKSDTELDYSEKLLLAYSSLNSLGEFNSQSDVAKLANMYIEAGDNLSARTLIEDYWVSSSRPIVPDGSLNDDEAYRAAYNVYKTSSETYEAENKEIVDIGIVPVTYTEADINASSEAELLSRLYNFATSGDSTALFKLLLDKSELAPLHSENYWRYYTYSPTGTGTLIKVGSSRLTFYDNIPYIYLLHPNGEVTYSYAVINKSGYSMLYSINYNNNGDFTSTTERVQVNADGTWKYSFLEEPTVNGICEGNASYSFTKGSSGVTDAMEMWEKRAEYKASADVYYGNFSNGYTTLSQYGMKDGEIKVGEINGSYFYHYGLGDGVNSSNYQFGTLNESYPDW